jgi:hypothetical protein
MLTGRSDARARTKMRNGIERLLDVARRTVGLTSDDAEFRALVAPGEHETRRLALSKLSTCALFLRGCLARALLRADADLAVLSPATGSRCPATVPARLWAPYATGHAMADLVAVHQGCRGSRVGAWRVPQAPLDVVELQVLRDRIVPGALVIVNAGRSEHGYLVESIERDGWPDGSVELTAIEAGQVDVQGRQCVRRRRHEIGAAGVDSVPSIESGRGLITEARLRRSVIWVLDPRSLLGDAS